MPGTWDSCTDCGGGMECRGKGSMINKIIQPLDPRGFKVTCIASPSRDEQLRPFLWRFWRSTPSARKWPFLTGVGTGILLDEVVDGNLMSRI